MAGIKIRTLNDVFYSVVERQGSRVMNYRDGDAWVSISAQQLYRKVASTARALRSWGLQPGERVAILSENRAEWAIADFAILLLGGVDVPVYATLLEDQLALLLRDSGARFLFVSTAAQLRKFEKIRRQTQVERVIVMDDVAGADAVPMASIMNVGGPVPDPDLDAQAHAISPDALATIIYTSGTTGDPKGVMLTHGNFASNLSVSLERYSFLPNDARIVSFLPLSHVTARHLDYAMLYWGVELYYCPFPDQLVHMLPEVRPTLFVGVPRVYEKIRNQVQLRAAYGIKHKVYKWAMRVGAEHRREILAGQTPRAIGWKIANKVLYSKIRKAMGGAVQYFLAGGAPLGRELAEWYADVGMRIHEGYGLTETSPVIALNAPSAHRLGTVGTPMRNLELRIAPDGELLVKGPSVFRGYWNRPDETAAAFDGDWFKTGDVAEIDSEGYLTITDRKKDLIKTSGGKYIAPQPIESSLKANPMLAEAAVVGERRKFPAALIFPNFAALEDWARKNQVHFADRRELCAHPRVQKLYESIVEQTNAGLAQFEKLKKFLLIPEDLSIAEGTLTPSMKMRRRKIEERFREEIEELYGRELTTVPPG